MCVRVWACVRVDEATNAGAACHNPAGCFVRLPTLCGYAGTSSDGCMHLPEPHTFAVCLHHGQADLSRRVAKVKSLQAVLAQIMETRRHARDAAAVAVRHAREVRGVLVGSVQRLLAGNQAIAKLDDVMRPSVSCVLCMEPMTKVPSLSAQASCAHGFMHSCPALSCAVQAVAFPFCGHSHCLKCIFNAAKAESSQVAGGVVASCSSTATIRCPTCVRQARHDWVRDNGSGAEQFEISKARQRRVVVLLDKEQHGADMKPPSASHANDAQMHRGVQMAFASALDDNLDPALPWVAAVRRRPLSSLRPNPVVDEVVGRLHTWNATMSHVTKTVAYLEHLLTATKQLQSADELAAAAKGAGLIGAPLPLAPDAVDKAARALLGDE